MRELSLLRLVWSLAAVNLRHRRRARNGVAAASRIAEFASGRGVAVAEWRKLLDFVFDLSVSLRKLLFGVLEFLEF